MELLAVAILLTVGLVVGSFIAALTYRLPRDLSFVKGRSFCPKCRKQISWQDNIPLLSFLLLKGQCRRCKKKISWRYPLIELSSGIGFVLVGLGPLGQGLTLSGVFLLLFFCLLLAIFIIDLENQIVPDGLVFAGYLLVATFLLLTNNNDLYLHLFSGFLAADFLLLLHLITKGKGMGLGDVKLALFLGMYLGFPYSIVWLFLAFLTGAAVGGILILAGRVSFGKHIAFGPFLVVAFWLAVFWGNKFWALLF